MDVTAPPDRSRLSLYLDLIRWDRPAGTLLLLWPTLSALWIAAGGFPGWHLVVVFVVGTFLMRSAGCAANDVADRDFDLHVKRTAQRPVTSGAVSVAEALTLGAALALVAFALVLTTNLAAVAWSFGLGDSLVAVINNSSGADKQADFNVIDEMAEANLRISILTGELVADRQPVIQLIELQSRRLDRQDLWLKDHEDRLRRFEPGV